MKTFNFFYILMSDKKTYVNFKNNLYRIFNINRLIIKFRLLKNTTATYIFIIKKANRSYLVGNYSHKLTSDNKHYVNLFSFLGKSGAQVGITFFDLLKFVYFPRPSPIIPNQPKRIFPW
jgi:hypothetical protein